MLHNNCPWCGYSYKEVRPTAKHSPEHLWYTFVPTAFVCGHCGNEGHKSPKLVLGAVFLYVVSVGFIKTLFTYFYIETMLIVGILLAAIASFIYYTQPYVRSKAKDGKAHDFYEADVRIEWNERGEQNSIPFRSLRIRPGEVFVIDNAAMTEGDIKPFIIIDRFHKSTKKTKAKIRVPVEVSLGDAFHLLVNGEAAATCRVEEE